jgi:hypothetical protein
MNEKRPRAKSVAERKMVRGVKNPNSPLIAGLQIYHNYVRPHMALEGKTPAEAAGIEVQGQDKWITLIQNASNKQRESTYKNTSKP